MKAGSLGSRAAIVVATLTAHIAHAQPPLDVRQAKQLFAEAKAASDKDGGGLWHQPLYGKILLVDPQTGVTISNEADANGVLKLTDGVYVGTLPKDVTISSAPTEWAGSRWTMLIWGFLPDNRVDRAVTFAHEMFHRIQPGLHLMADDAPCLHLDTVEGRVWMELEWRALAAALIETGPAQTQAIRDALAFRAYRQSRFANSRQNEASQEIAEGVPEYTGVVTGEADIQAARWRAVRRLVQPDTSTSLVRSFAYISGPAYGLLLDERSPGWRTRLDEHSDLAAMLASSVGDQPQGPTESRAALYGASEIRAMEADRAAKGEAERARLRALLVTGPTLTAPGAGNFTFNPNTLISLGDGYTVYPSFHAVAKWGTLDVKDGVRVSTDFSSVIVAAPNKVHGAHLEGPGWILDLAPGWSVGAGLRPGDLVLKH